MHPDTSLSSPFSSAFLHDRTVFVVGVAVADVLKRNVFAQRTKATARRRATRLTKKLFQNRNSRVRRRRATTTATSISILLFSAAAAAALHRFRILFMLISLALSLTARRASVCKSDQIPCPLRSLSLSLHLSRRRVTGSNQWYQK